MDQLKPCPTCGRPMEQVLGVNQLVRVNGTVQLIQRWRCAHLECHPALAAHPLAG